MLFCHVIADYNLQGWLATAKQKEYWSEKLYRNDYKMALFMHALSWTFVVFIPIFAYLIFSWQTYKVTWLLPIFAIDVCLHAIIDNEKANNKVLSLCDDQFMHLIQIAGTFVVFLVVVNL